MARANRTGVRGLFKDRYGRYRIDLRHTDPRTGVEHRHKEVLPLGTTAGAARLRAQAVLTDALAGRPTKAAAGQVSTLAQAFDEWRRLNPGNNPKQRERHCKQLLALIGDVPLADVNELAIARYARDRSAMTRENKNAKNASTEKVSAATVNRELQTLGSFFTSAVEWKWIESRPKIRLLKEQPGRVRWLSDTEREKLYAKLPVRFKRVVLAAALSGQRLANILSLTRAAVDLKHHTMSIPKTKSGQRHDVPLSGPLEAVIKEAIADGDAMAAAGDLDLPAHVFLSRHGQPYTSSGVSGLFKKVVKRAGVKDFHFHDLRHDYATKLRRAGHGLDVVQELLGHASPVMTQRYAHIGKDELHRAVEAVAEGWSGLRIAPVLPPGKKKTAKNAPKKR
ncbi:MAG TPA: site-specific integrase [Polyangiaceae bacterium]|nr:site-specific integrase [Polyangiaceae bacterium]